MRSVSFRSALGAAAGAHAVLTLALALGPRAHASVARTEARAQDLVFEVNDEPEPGQPLAPAPSDSSEPPPARAAMATHEAAQALTPRAPVEILTASDTPPAPTDSAWHIDPYGHAPSPASSVDLGVGAGGYWKSIAATAPSPSTLASAEPSDAPERPSPDRILRDPLDAHDQALGLWRAGPITSAAHEAASSPNAPDEGAATYDVESDAQGHVTSVTLVSLGADQSGWSGVGRELLGLLKSKTLRVPPGAHGIRARLQITAKRTLPGGEHRESVPGAVPDDVAGSGEKTCEGEGIHRKCTKGSPVGVTGQWGDLSNIGQLRTRVVHAQILHEGTF